MDLRKYVQYIKHKTIIKHLSKKELSFKHTSVRAHMHPFKNALCRISTQMSEYMKSREKGPSSVVKRTYPHPM